MWRYLALLVPALAIAETKNEVKPFDPTSFADKVTAFKDSLGKIYVVPKPSYESNDRAWVFYGDGRTMYQQRQISSSYDGKAMGLSLWAPRAKNLPHGTITVDKNGASVVCAMKNSKHEKQALVPLTEAETKQLFAKAKFLPPFWKHNAAFFGRGDGTTYYLVDALRDEFGGAGHRLFIGKKGQMKEVPITDFTKDTAGTVVLTKAGELVISNDRSSVVWKLGKKSVDITPLDIPMNHYLVYRELGVYEQLGTICEDQ